MSRSSWCLFVVVAVNGIVVAGCGDSQSSVCFADDQRDDSEVCVVGAGSDLAFETSGLQPGSDFTSTTDRTGEVRSTVGEDGRLEGEVGLLGDFSGETITVAGTWESGTAFEIEVVVGE